MKSVPLYLLISIFLVSVSAKAQYIPKNITSKEWYQARKWVNKTYRSLDMNQKLGQLFIVALYTNKGEAYIENVRQLVEQEHLGGLILMQNDAKRHQSLVREFQSKSKVPMLIGMDAEWGLFQRIPTAYKLPWAITLGAVEDKNIIREMAAMIATEAKKIGVNWNFAPVVDVNTNPANPIIGNRSFGSDVENVIRSALAYSRGLQDNGVLASIKHFPGHGDTSIDSHHDLPVIEHGLERLQSVELAPFHALTQQNIGGVMVAHLFVPALEKGHQIPASISKNIITGFLKKRMKYKGLIITDALNMKAVSRHYKVGILEALAFEAGNDLMLFSENVRESKKQILQKIQSGKLSKRRLKESVKKILTAKYFLGLHHYKPNLNTDINTSVNREAHSLMAQKIYQHAITLIKDDGLLPVKPTDKIYYLPLEEAPHATFENELKKHTGITTVSKQETEFLPLESKIIVGIHKNNTTAYDPYTISEESLLIINQLSKKHKIILNIFASPYALKNIDITPVSTLLISYENNDDSMKATVKALLGATRILGKLPVDVNEQLKYGTRIIK